LERRSGEHSDKSVVHDAGGFLFVPPDLDQRAVNLRESETARRIVAHSDASESETVVAHVPEG
jgi:uncharacterized RmlC-like cupin family protein